MRGDVTVVADALVVALLAALVALALALCRRRRTRGIACCGTPGHSVRRVGPRDRARSRYRHETTLTIAGMTCEGCATRVENALNALPGTWARVRIADHTARVRTIDEPDRQAMREAVAKAGYALL